ncbi:arsenate-mycothiol transferase ArsC [Lichenifustis flavocetrariae]|uniref:Low molecular weight phosphatase family protein n=1 Tax=Lichenifustis flavocetrariae TaxID=2949735 RepID=A0AA42CIH3_9HYPH|nr:low molecular weight phosphatase family protein [Lichenifustis flavocetrariae]MCW6508374.1 low molecular weight phosphatase family protein [Lichenifustis flavocetrariae]
MTFGSTASVQSILFACSENAVRSPMAAALAGLQFGRSIYVASAGVRPGDRDPFVTSVMEEVGVDLSRHQPQMFESLEDTSFDLIVTLSPEAHHKALEFTRTMAVDVVYWPTMDPTAVEGSRSVVLDAYRSVRDGLRDRIRATFGWRSAGTV